MRFVSLHRGWVILYCASTLRCHVTFVLTVTVKMFESIFFSLWFPVISIAPQTHQEGNSFAKFMAYISKK